LRVAKAAPKRIACFLGAGFSYPAGVPLARDLFRQSWVLALSERSKNRFDAVLEHYAAWQGAHPHEHAEKYMALLFTGNAGTNPPRWEWIVEYVGAVIASAHTPSASLNRNPRYSNRVNRPFYCDAHRHFWDTLLGVSNDISVVTTNYDILVERLLRHRPMQRPKSLGCFYGGLERPQILTGAPQPFSRFAQDRIIEMTGSIPVFKLHGSLNWTLDGKSVLAYQDMRAAFRHGGEAAIIPPVPEKSVPVWLQQIWKEAATALSLADVWIVCGYSMPDYDTHVRQLLQSAGGTRSLPVLILSPDADDLVKKWEALLPLSKPVPFPGLPEGTNSLAKWLERYSFGDHE
jgi:hypothetical protein